MSRYLIGDVHGCLKTLEALVEKLEPGVPVTMLGDLIDRGPRDAGVVQFVMDQGYDCIMGNHEHMMLDEWLAKKFDTHRRVYQIGIWGMNGGIGLEAFTEEQLRWLATRPHYIKYDDLKNEKGLALFACHGGVRHHIADSISPEKLSHYLRIEQTILWYRHTPGRLPGYFQVTGHSVTKEPIIAEHYARIDTGCVNSIYELECHKLTALRFPEMEIVQQLFID